MRNLLHSTTKLMRNLLHCTDPYFPFKPSAEKRENMFSYYSCVMPFYLCRIHHTVLSKLHTCKMSSNCGKIGRLSDVHGGCPTSAIRGDKDQACWTSTSPFLCSLGAKSCQRSLTVAHPLSSIEENQSQHSCLCGTLENFCRKTT